MSIMVKLGCLGLIGSLVVRRLEQSSAMMNSSMSSKMAMNTALISLKFGSICLIESRERM